MDDQSLTGLSPAIALIWIAISVVVSLIVALIRHRRSPNQQYWLDNARWILIPYIALLVGHLSPRLMGLTEINWLSSVSIGAGFIGIVLILLTLVLTSSTALVQPDQIPLHGQTVPHAPRGSAARNFNTAQIIVSSATEQFHWTFLRAALWESLLRIGYSSAASTYIGIWFGGLIAALELLLHKRDAARRLIDITALLLTSILFFYTRNFWLCWALHLLVVALLKPQVTPAATQ